MLRHTLSVVTIGLAVAVVGAQGPKNPSPAQLGELFKKNRPVVEQIVDQTVTSSRHSNERVRQAGTYYPVLLKFNQEIAEATRHHDTARVEELSRHLGTLIDQGLAPTLIKAREQVEHGTGVEEYRQVREDLVGQVDALMGMLGDNPAAKASLEGARKRLDEVSGPKK